MSGEQREDDLDEDEQRIFDLWGMTYKEQKAFARWLLVVAAVAVVAIVTVFATVFFLHQ